MMAQTQINLAGENQRGSLQTDRDQAGLEAVVDITSIFDLGSSGGSNIARNKDSMIAEAFQSAHPKLRQGQDIQPS